MAERHDQIPHGSQKSAVSCVLLIDKLLDIRFVMFRDFKKGVKTMNKIRIIYVAPDGDAEERELFEGISCRPWIKTKIIEVIEDEEG